MTEILFDTPLSCHCEEGNVFVSIYMSATFTKVQDTNLMRPVCAKGSTVV